MDDEYLLLAGALRVFIQLVSQYKYNSKDDDYEQ